MAADAGVDPQMVEMMAEAAAAPSPASYEQEVNLAKILPEKFLVAVGERVVRDKDIDLGSSEGWRKRKARWVQLFSGEIPSKNAFEKNLLFVHMPYLTKAVNLFHPRMHRHFFPASGDFYTWDTAVPDRKTQARKITRHTNYYLRKRVPEYVPSYDRGGVQILLYGSAFSVWYYNPLERRPCFEFINSDNFIVPYKCKSDRPDMADVPRKSWIKEYYRHELEQLADDDYYVNVAKLYPQPYGEDGAPTPGAGDQPQRQGEVQRTADDIQGTKPPSHDDDAPRKIIEQDRWLLLPGEKRQRHVTVCVDEMTRTVLRLTLCEKDDPRDAQRYRREMQLRDAEMQAANEAYNIALDEHAAMAVPGVDEFGNPLPAPDPAMLPLPPSPPQEPPLPAPARKVPFHRFTHYPCLPNPEGFYHYGIGVLVEGPNIVANEAMSGYASLMRLNQRPTGVQSRFARGPRGEQKLVLGEVTETQLTPEQVNAGAGIHVLQFPPPDPNAFKLEERMAQSVQEITVDDVVGGAEGMSGQTAAETEIRNANAMEGISTIAARIDRSRLNEQQVFAYILSQTLDEEGDTFSYQAPRDQSIPEWEPPPPVEEFHVTREDYAALEDFDIVSTSDPNMASQPQREAKAMKMLQALTQIPPGTFDPVTTALITRSVAHKFFTSMDEPALAEMVARAEPPQMPVTPEMQGEQPEGESPDDPGQPTEAMAADGGDAGIHPGIAGMA